MALENDLLGLVPITVGPGSLEVGGLVAIEVLEDAVLVLEAAILCLLGSGSVANGGETTGSLDASSGDGGGKARGGDRRGRDPRGVAHSEHDDVAVNGGGVVEGEQGRFRWGEWR